VRLVWCGAGLTHAVRGGYGALLVAHLLLVAGGDETPSGTLAAPMLVKIHGRVLVTDGWVRVTMDGWVLEVTDGRRVAVIDWWARVVIDGQVWMVIDGQVWMVFDG
jgi:hypothetical protein